MTGRHVHVSGHAYSGVFDFAEAFLESEPVSRSVDHHQARDTDPENARGSNKGPAKPARRIEPAMAAESDHDIPLQEGGVPTG